MNGKKQPLLKNLGTGLIILIVIVFAYRFITWNYWKVEQAVTQAKKILAAPPAINITLSKDNTIVFQKSFAYHAQGNYYIINQFDIGPYIGKNLDLTLSIDREKSDSLLLYRFKHFNIIVSRGYHFVFTTARCGIEEFIKMKDSMPLIINSLSELAANNKQAQGNDNIMNEFIEARVVTDLSSK